MSTSARFTGLLGNLKLTDDQKAKGSERREAVISRLNAVYWGSYSGTTNSLYVGSWAKRTRIRPPRDVDVLFRLPYSVYERFQLRSGNRQSQLLQEVKSHLVSAYPYTDIRGSGPVVIVPFASYNVEVIPAFEATGGGHLVCMTDGGGHYKRTDYAAETTSIANSDNGSGGKTRDLTRMMKAWQRYCSVPIKSFHIELLVIQFLANWTHRDKSKTYYDWMVRDFLQFMVNSANSYVFAPGTGEAMSLGNAWQSRAQSALDRAKKAVEFDAAQRWSEGGDEWQKIFGTDIPKYV